MADRRTLVERGLSPQRAAALAKERHAFFAFRQQFALPDTTQAVVLYLAWLAQSDVTGGSAVPGKLIEDGYGRASTITV